MLFRCAAYAERCNQAVNVGVGVFVFETGELYSFPLQEWFIILWYLVQESKLGRKRKYLPLKEGIFLFQAKSNELSIKAIFFQITISIGILYRSRGIAHINQPGFACHLLACYCKVERLVAVGSTWTPPGSLIYHEDCTPFGQGTPLSFCETYFIVCSALLFLLVNL